LFAFSYAIYRFTPPFFPALSQLIYLDDLQDFHRAGYIAFSTNPSLWCWRFFVAAKGLESLSIRLINYCLKFAIFFLIGVWFFFFTIWFINLLLFFKNLKSYKPFEKKHGYQEKKYWIIKVLRDYVFLYSMCFSYFYGILYFYIPCVSRIASKCINLRKREIWNLVEVLQCYKAARDSTSFLGTSWYTWNKVHCQLSLNSTSSWYAMKFHEDQLRAHLRYFLAIQSPW